MRIVIVSNLFMACKKTDLLLPDKNQKTDITTAAIDSFIFKQLKTFHHFEWSMASEEMIWASIIASDNIISIGYKPIGIGAVDNNMHQININNEKWKEAKLTIINQILASEQKINPSLKIESIVPWEERVLPVINIVIKNPSTLTLLLSNNRVRYVEPMSYEPKTTQYDADKKFNSVNAISSSSGCGSNTPFFGLVENTDYTNISPFSKQSWNYSYHSIPKAWNKTTGWGIKVFFIDTGCEYDQENLGPAFNQGLSQGRSIEKIVTLPRSTFLGIPIGTIEIPDDGCGHGTAMAGVCAAPRGIDGNACGVAYNCNLITCRAAEDVYLDDSREVKGVADAFTNAANRNDVKIISMSMGKLTSSSQITDAINYAVGKGKLIFCAAGTSLSWTSGWAGVIFPASLSQVNAVTGVRNNNFNATCTDCHDGSETDFTIVMERAIDDRHPLTLAMFGDTPSTIGGSSVSTATAAAIAALVWSRFPAYTKDQILNKLIQTSRNYPVRSNNLGWGNLNADAATN